MRATLPSESKDRGTDPSRSPLIPATEKKPAGASASEKLCIDEMLQKYCGEFGRWQLKHFILTSLAWALEAFHTMVIIFADREPEWQCLDGAGGAGIFGHLSDSFLGRKGSLTVVCALNTVFGTLTAFSPSYSFYVLFRLLTGCSTGGVGLCAFGVALCAFVLATEPVGPKMRGTVGMSTFYFFSSGIALLSVLAYIFPAWRNLYIVSSLSSLVFLVFVLPFVSESPRWYLVRGRKSEAMKIMSTIATSNGNHLPQGVRVVCGILGIFGMAGTYNLLFIYTAELFPTVVRNAALGCATQAAQMGAILAPLVVVLGGSLPFLVFALCGIVGGVFAFYLPETLNQPLYDTLTGMEAKENTAISTKV
ncbi:Organic cation/carnitine transporter 4 [Glycine soja]|uniref:Organic cation/carnitine transporter 4 n=1 Tax=Glycine soja TaxID=3848 RepID=A0A0B2R899_GLYSO|nr:Organic cation/carnitine transporter 4 [Glycine soja]